MRKKVLLFCFKLDRGGIESLLMGVIPRLQDEYEFYITTFGKDPNELQQEFEDLGCHVHRLQESRYKHPGRFVQEVQDYIEANGIRIVHCHAGYSTAFGLRAAAKAGVPHRIAHSHNSEFGTKGSPLNRALQVICKNACHTYATTRVAVSDLAKAAMFKKTDLVYLIPNGIDLDHFAFNESLREATRTTLGIGNDEVVLLNVARMTEIKNQAFLINIFNEFRKNQSKSRLLLVGDGETREKLETQVKSLGLANSVIFTGSVSDASAYYSTANAFVLPSLFEGLPVSLVEAQANGLHCFVSDTVAKEADISGNMTRLSLDEGAEFWTETIAGFVGSHERTPQSSIPAKYGIDHTAKMFRELYKDVLSTSAIMGR